MEYSFLCHEQSINLSILESKRVWVGMYCPSSAQDVETISYRSDFPLLHMTLAF